VVTDRTAARAWLGRAMAWFAPSLVVVGRRAADSLYILQLERYMPRRFGDWLGRHRAQLVPPWDAGLHALILAAAALLVRAGFPLVGPLAAWVLGGQLLRRRFRSLQVSNRVQWTARALRVAGAAAVLAVILAGLVVLAALDSFPASWWLLGLLIALAVVDLAVPSLVLIAAAAAAPIERRVARRYLAQAEARMRRFPGRVLGITGSYGKTSTKYVVADLLGTLYRVFKTPAGVNTTMGITRIIRDELSDACQYFLVEMSAYGPGEIREVCDLVHPSLGILTAVGVQHLERFGTPERIAEAKYELIAALPAGAPAVINADDPVCLRLAERARTEGKRVLLYGLEARPGLAVHGTDLAMDARGTRFTATTGSGAEVFETKLLGRWNISNILAGIAAAAECGVPLAAMKAAVAGLVPAPRRLEIHEEGGIVRILDVANANPRGAEMALEVLGQFAGGSRILITPGMVELGPIEAEENRRLGERAAAVCDYVLLVGPEQTRPIREGLTGKGFPADRILTARQAGEVGDLLAPIVKPGDVLLYENRLPDTYLEVA
jgi:UDP-N-acetylmuramoyl-tripeptide--D-alanyl-D-alanine ligase